MMKPIVAVTFLLASLISLTACDRQESPSRPQRAGGGAAAVAAEPKELVLDLGNSVTMKLVKIPAGRLVLSGPENADDRDQDKSHRELAIGRPFYLGIYEVTVDQFRVFVENSGYVTDMEKAGPSPCYEIRDGNFYMNVVGGHSWRNPGFVQKGDHPAVCVSWNDAQAFCAWLSKKSGSVAHLPTTVQWEYACRAGTQTTYPWGAKPDDGNGWANCADQSLRKALFNQVADPKSPSFSWEDGYVYTSPVGSFKPNSFGLYDMVGNVWEWCDDVYDGNVGLKMGRLGGGSWLHDPKNCGSSHLTGWSLGMSMGDAGFRVAVDSPEAKADNHHGETR